MNYKLHREDYYNEEYNLNPQEEKEFVMPLQDPYWLVRGRAFLLEIPIFGEKSTIKQNLEILLFNLNNNNTTVDMEKVTPSQNEAKLKASLDLFERKYGKSETKEIFSFENVNYFESLPGYKKNILPIYSYIPELKLMKKTLSYPEIYNAISRLADPHMVFINMFKENPSNNLISGIVYFPFTPSILEHPNVNSDFILKLSKFFGLHANYNLSFENEKIKILKQKLMDLFYLVDDCEDLHGVTSCQSTHRKCEDISSFFCENNMCKVCCEETVHKEFCIIHDDMVNFYRKKMQDLLEFEHRKGFDRSTTVRISIRQRVTKYELKSMFEENNYNINWDNVDFSFRKGVEKIQFVYLQCNTNEDAKRLYEDRGKLMQKWEKLEVNIQSLMENIEDIICRVYSVQASAIIVVPVSNIISNNKRIPKKSNRNKAFTEMIEKSLNINATQYKLANCQNRINNEFSYDYYIVQFSSKELLDTFYNAQPYLDSVIVHKLSHLKFFPLLRTRTRLGVTKSSLCINCSNEKRKDCVFELCADCCGRQDKDNLILKKITSILKCPCREESKNSNLHNNNFNNKSEIILKCKICNSTNPIEFDSKCYMITELCESCCSVQMFPHKICVIHSQRASINNMGVLSHEFNFQNFINKYQLDLSTIKLKLMANLKNGDFHWFRSIEDTNFTRLMLDMNKELMIIMDNPNFRREGPLRINDKMYKIFTYQHEELTRKSYSIVQGQGNSSIIGTTEGFDQNGDFYLEYDFTGNKEEEVYSPDCFVPSSVEKLEYLDIKNSERDLDELMKSLKNSFHLIIYGLDAERFSTYDLSEEIFQELRTEFGKINKEDIHVLDEQSIINYVIINNPSFNSYDKFTMYGRFALIKFKQEKDALKFYLEKARISLPLSNGKKGVPLMYPGELLRKYVEEFK